MGTVITPVHDWKTTKKKFTWLRRRERFLGVLSKWSKKLNCLWSLNLALLFWGAGGMFILIGTINFVRDNNTSALSGGLVIAILLTVVGSAFFRKRDEVRRVTVERTDLPPSAA